MNKIITILKMLIYIPIRLFSKISVLTIIKNSKISKNTAILSFCKIYNSEIGRYTYLGRGTNLFNVKIGNFTSIADSCIIGAASHPIDKVSTSPVFYTKNNIFNRYFVLHNFKEYKETSIANDVWVGTHAFIKSGVKIGDGAIIGAYSVVTKDVEPFTIVAGNPARVIRCRFSQEIINKLLNIKWWDWTDEEIEINGEKFLDINEFINIKF